MKRLIYSLIFLLGSQLHALSQEDSIVYFDQNWEETTKDSAAFYRLIGKKPNGMFHIRDFFLSGKLQMEGDYSSLDPDLQQGYFTYYFENGQKFAEGNYVRGQRNGIWTFWYPDGVKRQELKFFNKRGDYAFKWLSKREKKSIIFIDKAILKRKRGNPEMAEEFLNSAIAINPYSADAFYQRGLLKCSQHRNEAGCEDLKKARDFGFFDIKTINEAIAGCCKSP